MGQICTHPWSKSKLTYILAESDVSFMEEKVISLVEGNANVGINIFFSSSYKKYTEWKWGQEEKHD